MTAHDQRTKCAAKRRFARRLLSRALVLSATGAIATGIGCASSPKVWKKTIGQSAAEMQYVTAQVDTPTPPVIEQVAFAAAPLTAKNVDNADTIYIEMSLGTVIEQALIYSEVFRDIGGVVLRSPDTIKTNLSDSLQQTDPQFGMESALSAFDATLTASSTYSNNDRLFNNAFFAGGATSFQQDLHEHQIELSKRTATGSTLALRTLTEYDANNAPANTFPSAFQTQVEGEMRQPLLQGGGLEFNRIAGPGSRPGVYNGVLIARTNYDINHADFETALRDFVSNVENAYWDLYLAYRELDAKKKATEQALVLWNEAKSQSAGEIVNKAQEALARQQYFRLKADVDEALSGRLLNGTQTRNGSNGGTVQSAGGILAAERRLRLLIGLPANDGTLIRPEDEPPMARIPFNWDVCLDEAMSQRPELHRQNATLKKREMELLAARNFLNPRLDAVGRYRYRGFGDDFLGGGPQVAPNPTSSVGQLFTGDNQEWSVGVELSMPVGFRQAHAAVTHAQLSLARARTVQREQQREIVSDLSGAFADTERAHQQVQNKLNQYLAAKEYFTALKIQKEEQGLSVPADRLVDAMDRVVRAEVEFFRSRAEYAVALKNIHYEKGTILQYKDLRIAGANNESIGGDLDIPPMAEPQDDVEAEEYSPEPTPAVDVTELIEQSSLEPVTEPVLPEWVSEPTESTSVPPVPALAEETPADAEAEKPLSTLASDIELRQPHPEYCPSAIIEEDHTADWKQEQIVESDLTFDTPVNAERQDAHEEPTNEWTKLDGAHDAPNNQRHKSIHADRFARPIPIPSDHEDRSKTANEFSEIIHAPAPPQEPIDDEPSTFDNVQFRSTDSVHIPGEGEITVKTVQLDSSTINPSTNGNEQPAVQEASPLVDEDRAEINEFIALPAGDRGLSRRRGQHGVAANLVRPQPVIARPLTSSQDSLVPAIPTPKPSIVQQPEIQPVVLKPTAQDAHAVKQSGATIHLHRPKPATQPTIAKPAAVVPPAIEAKPFSIARPRPFTAR